MAENDVRLYLHAQLETAFPNLELYFRPPGNMFLSRPCIIYEPKEFEPSFANSGAYIVGTKFQLTLLSDLPGYTSVQSVYDMPGVVVQSTRSYVTDDIVHDVAIVSVNSII
jgi:hypothetical protein